MPNHMSRRTLLQTTGATAAMLALGGRIRAQSAPFSSGESRPTIFVPPKACDAHIHIFDTRFPASPHWTGQPVEDATVAAYRQLQARIGTSRAVIVNPSTYGIDNRCTLEATQRMGRDARAVVVVDTDIAPTDLKTMADQGAVGVRVNFVTEQSWGETTVQRLQDTCRLIAPLGWHVQIYAKAEQIEAMSDVLAGLPVPLVIDHLGRLPLPDGVDHPAFTTVRRLLDGGNTWVKLSGAYLNTETGAPAYADATVIAKVLAEAAPERMVWGSDWPHRGQKSLPDDAVLIDLLAEWVPDETTRNRILVENPVQLYGFQE
ncbi:Predicted metal-dependent hydrolase, TIM-barrel fold [Paracoccus aminovorans]|uniref:Predicted metal-dependent hydrolase, TIM-barrel fold n=1 Tax=Paracoccus aminovorans TaxID=34004 RepID=A0A1I3EKU7_9RHOB|nr:amidohydrolase family protein [Paracoccus aminovorans]CQR87590.1 2-pyrone-4,6-dicarboxylic acid hydrolase [Paracoccus aminovorans]SFH99597.1 Predicted metal-dependent hydrolase, TIM-barrel fold [Paracoccus aminovorans]